MPKGYKNWNFRNVDSFLRDNGFRVHHTNGSHYYYLGNNQHMVCVPFHGSKTIKLRTLKGIITQSGIDRKKWFS